MEKEFRKKIMEMVKIYPKLDELSIALEDLESEYYDLSDVAKGDGEQEEGDVIGYLGSCFQDVKDLADFLAKYITENQKFFDENFEE